MLPGRAGLLLSMCVAPSVLGPSISQAGAQGQGHVTSGGQTHKFRPTLGGSQARATHVAPSWPETAQPAPSGLHGCTEQGPCASPSIYPEDGKLKPESAPASGATALGHGDPLHALFLSISAGACATLPSI